MDKDQAVKVWLLTSSQRVFDGVVILKKIPEDYREESIKKKKRTKKQLAKPRLTNMLSLPLYLAGLL